MVSLTLIKTEAEELVRRIPRSNNHQLQSELVKLCEAHWRTLRGPQPSAPLAQILWFSTPPLADLLVDLYTQGDTPLSSILPNFDLARGLAVIVLAEIQQGNEFGVHIAHEPMKAYESNVPPPAWLNKISAMLHGTLDAPFLHLHDRHNALWKSLAIIAAQTKRLDLVAIQAVIQSLTMCDSSNNPSDPALEKLRQSVAEAGIVFLKMDKNLIQYEQHHKPHKPVRTRQLGELLLEIRQLWLR